MRETPAQGVARFPRRTVFVAVRDYLGFDAHGWRRVLLSALIATAVGTALLLYG
ncbi:hypothetical protein ACIRS1_25465 [Kitasatospora sp. NPDC101176]|uniref:hypothetical protein n=1 Tax=Kitasatospora sp. NPDC101176 TaxID=3364099 RepID=UPI003810475A